MSVRIKDLTTTATSPASDDYLALDGATNGTRKIPASSIGGGGTSDDITNASTVTGSTVSDALETLSGEIANKLTTAQINALNGMFQACAYAEDATAEYATFCEAFGLATLTSVTAVYTQSGTVYDTDTLDSLKSDLVVTANYSDGTSEAVTTYTLSGTLTVGTSTVTVSYGGKTTSFTVTVTHYDPYWMTLTLDDDFVAFGLQDAKGSNQTYPYTQASTNRTSYPFFDILISSDYKYTFEYDGTSVSLGIPYYSSGAETAVANGASISSYKTDAGWKSTGYSFTPPAGSWCMRLTLNNNPTNLASAGFTTLHITREAMS